MDPKLEKALNEADFDYIGEPDDALSVAADICEVLRDYLVKEQPYAERTIEALNHAIDALRSSAVED